jgi:methylenetetrahydrofolate dehydrogenase (NADP+)/methenyltetrahydrofolate cyclohydrolase
MTATIIDGKAVAARVRAEVTQEVAQFVSEFGRPPSLHVLLVGDDPASHIYVRNKEKAARDVGIDGVTHRLAGDTSEDALVALVEQLSSDALVDGILVQLPLPAGLSEHRVLDRVAHGKDVDGLHPINAGLLASGREALLPCTPQGCLRLLDETGTQLRGLRAVVVGRSILVGKPVAQLLLSRHATVTIAHSRTQDLPAVCHGADVLVAAVGKTHLIQGDWIKEGAVVIDVGTNRGEDGKLRGDVDFEAARLRARAITPVPGGVGPMTIAYLLKNTVVAARARLAR